jgi:hypothetical protein
MLPDHGSAEIQNPLRSKRPRDNRLYLISTAKVPARSLATTAEFVMPLKLGVK